MKIYATGRNVATRNSKRTDKHNKHYSKCWSNALMSLHRKQRILGNLFGLQNQIVWGELKKKRNVVDELNKTYTVDFYLSVSSAQSLLWSWAFFDFAVRGVLEKWKICPRKSLKSPWIFIPKKHTNPVVYKKIIGFVPRSIQILIRCVANDCIYLL